MDTESQYSIFWNAMGKEYLGLEDFGRIIKGQTLFQIFCRHFDGMVREQEEIVRKLNEYEAGMNYDYIPGADSFMRQLKAAGVPMAIVTSSNEPKMRNVRRAHPECFLKGMEVLGGKSSETYVFEDSLHGINAGRAAGAKVIGLATTNPRETIAPLCDIVIDDFRGFTLN